MTKFLDQRAAAEHLEAEGFVRVPAKNGLMMYYRGDQLAMVSRPNVAAGLVNTTTIGYETLDAAKIASVQSIIAAAK